MVSCELKKRTHWESRRGRFKNATNRESNATSDDYNEVSYQTANLGSPRGTRRREKDNVHTGPSSANPISNITCN